LILILLILVTKSDSLHISPLVNNINMCLLLYFNIYIYIYIYQDKSIATGIFFLELLSAVERRVVNWKVVTKGEDGVFSLLIIFSLLKVK
jgi:hypothetical protein